MSGRAPDWISEAWHVTLEDVRAYLRTTAAFAFKPYPSARRWAEGEARDFMNPVGVLAAAAVVLGPTRQLAYQVLGIGGGGGLVATLLSALGPFAHYAAIGLLTHLVLTLGSPSRARLVDSIGITLLVGGGPAAAAELAAWLVSLALHAALPGLGVAAMLGVTLGVAFSVFSMTLGSALAGLHRPPALRLLLAFAVAFALTGLVFGTLHPPGEYGMHWVVRLQRPWIGLGW